MVTGVVPAQAAEAFRKQQLSFVKGQTCFSTSQADKGMLLIPQYKFEKAPAGSSQVETFDLSGVQFH